MSLTAASSGRWSLTGLATHAGLVTIIVTGIIVGATLYARISPHVDHQA